jgi:hypothetical protein
LHETTGPFKSSTPNYLASISEFDELYDSPVFIQDSTVDYDSTGPDIDIYGADTPNYSSNTLDSRTDNFFMTLAAADRYGSEETENFDMNVSGTEEEDGFEARGRNKDRSEDENSVLALSMEELYVRRPQAAVNKRTKPKAVKQAKDANHPSNSAAHASYDPDTCCITRDVLERREERIVSREVLTKRRYVLVNEVARFLRSQVQRFQDSRSWTMKYARLRRSKVETRVQSRFLKYLAMRNRRTVRNMMESYE